MTTGINVATLDKREGVFMDLYAYSQMDILDKIAKKNGIGVARCRGYRLMLDEEPISKDQINEIIKKSEYEAVEEARAAGFVYNSTCLTFDNYQSAWMDRHTDRDARTVRWNTIHGYQRKCCKWYCKQKRKAIELDLGLFNKYAGRDDVLYIHAKEGSWSWSGKWWDYKNQPWFLDACDDYDDPAYCDIFAKIEPLTEEEKNKLKELEEND